MNITKEMASTPVAKTGDKVLKTASGKTVEKPRYFDPEQYLVSTLKRAVANRQNVEVAVDGVGKVVVLPERGEYFSNSVDLEMFCQADQSLINVTVLESGNESIPRHVGRNLGELMWHAGFYASRGRLLNGLLRDDVVGLLYWPNFTRLPMTPNSMRLTALLLRHPTSITLAMRLLKIAPEEAYQFYTAAHCAGMVQVLNRKATEPELKPHRNQALLGLLLHKIAGL